MMIAAIYARVSTDEQAERDHSIPAQIRAIREYCKKDNIHIFSEYVDEGISGQKENRPSFQKMIKDAKAKKFTIILVHKFDRFARKVEISRKIKDELKNAGVSVISITEPIEDSPIGFFQEGLLELLAEYYVRNLSKEVKKGMTERARKGKHMGSMPYGYKVENGTVKVDADEAKIVAKIFELYNNGWGRLKICNWLNSNNIPTSKGKRWQAKAIKFILCNSKYIGKSSWDGQVYDAEFPALVDEITFNNVQNQVSKRSGENTYRGSNYNSFLLLGFLRCGLCGKKCRIKSTYNWDRRKYPVYMCSQASLYRNQCSFTKMLRTEALENDVLNYVGDILDNKVIDFIVVDDKPMDISDILEERLRRVENELERAKQAYLAGVFSMDEYKQTKEALESKRISLAAEISEAAQPMSLSKKSQVISKIQSAWSIFLQSETIEDKKKILQQFIKVIHVFPDRIEVQFR